MNRELLAPVRQQVEVVFAFPAALCEVNRLSCDSLTPRRRQHTSARILCWIIAPAPPGAAKLLGITDADLFIPVLAFVFGEAQVYSQVAMVNAARLRLANDERRASPPLMEARLVKECLHELGHSFGLVHCPDEACVMSRSNSVLNVDQKRAAFCCDWTLRLGVPRQERGRS